MAAVLEILAPWREMPENLAQLSRRDINELVVRAYLASNHVKEEVVRRGFDGSKDVPVDSLVGEELLAAVEEECGVHVPSGESLNRGVRPSLRAYAELVERYAAKAAPARPMRVRPVHRARVSSGR